MATEPDLLDPDEVHDRDSFFSFVKELIDDRRAAAAAERVSPSSPYGPDAGGWENICIERYFVAALAWAEATNMGVSQGLPTEPSWKAFATFLYCGKIFE